MLLSVTLRKRLNVQIAQFFSGFKWERMRDAGQFFFSILIKGVFWGLQIKVAFC